MKKLTPIVCKRDDLKEALSWEMTMQVPWGLLLAETDGTIKPGLLSKFEAVSVRLVGATDLECSACGAMAMEAKNDG